MDHQYINSVLLRKIYIILSKSEIWGDEYIKVQDDFITKYYEVLKLCLDISITKQHLKKIIERGISNDYITLMKELSIIIDNEKTYIILNKFLIEYLVKLEEVNIKRNMEDSILVTNIRNEYNHIIKHKSLPLF